jgi:glutathione peroxidase
VIIAFPSNSFGNETRSNADIKQFCQNNYGASFRIAAKNNVMAAGLQPMYDWLADAEKNGMMAGVVGGDFQKFLIDKEGRLVGVYSPSVKPTHGSIISAITEN